MYPPIFIELAIWYYTTPRDHPAVIKDNGGGPAYLETVNQMLVLGLLKQADVIGQVYKSTDGLKVYVEALCSVPTPVLRWVMPNEN